MEITRSLSVRFLMLEFHVSKIDWIWLSVSLFALLILFSYIGFFFKLRNSVPIRFWTWPTHSNFNNRLVRSIVVKPELLWFYRVIFHYYYYYYCITFCGFTNKAKTLPRPLLLPQWVLMNENNDDRAKTPEVINILVQTFYRQLSRSYPFRKS